MHLRRMAEDAVLDVTHLDNTMSAGQIRQKSAELLQDRYGIHALALANYLDNAINAIGYLRQSYERAEQAENN